MPAGRLAPVSPARRRWSALDHDRRSVIVAMIAMRVMQPAVDQIVEVIAMRHRFVPASRAMDMAASMEGLALTGGAVGGVGRTDLDGMFVDMVAMHVVQMPIVKIVDMIAMPDRNVAAAWAVPMGVVGVDIAAFSHWNSPWSSV
jgi:hypothetical protein